MTDSPHADRVRGCLLGGAIGDALGWPVEFQRLDRILDDHGPDGVTGLRLRADRLAEVTDDTQMTLFTAEALLLSAGGDRSAVTAAVHAAYQRWFLTQRLSAPTADAADAEGSLLREPWLYASRAPGNACLSGVQEHRTVPRLVEPGAHGVVNPDSKGCGTVMRSAPFGLIGAGPDAAFRLASDGAQLTHGHPTGYVAAGAFAALVDRLVGGTAPLEAVMATIAQVVAQPGGEETVVALDRAVHLAASAAPEFGTVERVGLGWIAEECLAIAVHCLLTAGAEPDPEAVRRALTLSVTHSGDSDSTGAVCGNLLGAAHGLSALPEDWSAQVEGSGTILRTADELTARFAARPY